MSSQKETKLAERSTIVSANREARMLHEIEATMQAASDAGVVRVKITDQELRGSMVRIGGKDLINFGSCSYLGLGQDERLKQAATSAVRRFGPSYSSSAAYASVDLYTDLELKLQKIFRGNHVVPAPTTTLAHLAALPVLIGRDDAVVMDIQAHASLHLAADVLRGRGVSIKIVRHNDMEALRSSVSQLASEAAKVWYLADGIYSMHGDVAPINQVSQLMDDFENLYVYYDDAHGFGWAGEHGVGYVLERLDLNDRIFVAVSLSKSFGAGGGAVICHDEQTARKILLTGGTLTFGGPIHPAVLGAAVRSADLHLSPEHAERQKNLYDRIDTVNNLAKELRLPVKMHDRTPITFVRIGTTEQSIRCAKAMMVEGFYVNVAAYPAVPRGRGGIRFTVTADHSIDDIEALIYALSAYTSPPQMVDLRAEISLEAAQCDPDKRGRSLTLSVK